MNTWTSLNIKTHRIPELTQELKDRIERNTEHLISMTAKEWMKGRKKKDSMTTAEQKEQVRKLEKEILEDQ